MGKAARFRILPVGLMVLILLSVFAGPLTGLIKPVSAVTILTSKWSRSSLGTNWEGGVVVGDVTGDGQEDVIYGGNDLLSVLNGVTGTTIASVSQTRIGQYCQPQCYDVDGDGVLDILVPLYYLPGLAAYKYVGTSTLQQMWIVNTEGANGSGSVMAKPVAGDIDNDGHLDIFIGSQDVSPASIGTTGVISPNGYDGTVCRINYLGQIVAQTFTWRPCSGGLSLADTDNDGVFELYQGDRQMGYSDGGYGKGVRSFWAANLVERWNRLDFLSSSQSPVLADVNKDGVLDVLAGMYNEMWVLNSTNGEKISRWTGQRIFNNTENTISTHYGFSVSDIDADGNLELLCSDGDHDNDAHVDVLDLTTGSMDAQVSLGYTRDWKWSPTVANIYENGNNPNGTPRMELIMAANSTYGARGTLLIYDNQYNLLQNVTGLSTQIGYPFVQDIDGDDLLEVIVCQSGGTVRVYDTSMPAPGYSPSLPGSKRIRSEVTYFGEQRLGVAEHTVIPGDDDEDYYTAPLVRPTSPADNALAVSISADLSFELWDQQGDAISWTVNTYPDVGSGSGSIPANTQTWSTRTVTLPNLAYDTTYKWTVTATAGSQATKRVYTFRTEQAANPSNVAPTQGVPDLVPIDGLGMTTSTFRITPQSQSDLDPITNIYRWTVAGNSFAQLLLPFDTRDETVAKDYSGFGNNGQVIGATWVPNGRVGGAYSFDGKDDAIKISDGGVGYYNNQTSSTFNPELGGNPPGVTQWNAVTVEAWVYLTENNYGSLIVGKVPSYAIGFQNGATPNVLTASVWPALYGVNTDDNHASTDRMRSISYGTPLQLNTWYHVAFSYESGVGIKLYLNGALVASSSVYTGVIQRSSGEPVWIGRLVEPFAGMIDDVRLYKYALPLGQVLNRYNESKDGDSGSSLYMPVVFGAPGDVLGCDVIPTDSWAEGTTRSDTFTLLNTPPVASNPKVAPLRDRPYRLDGENLIASYDYSDPDGQVESGSQIRWYKGGVLQSSLNDLKTASAALTTVGDSWYFTVRPRDSAGALGVLVTSEAITIRGNSVPTTGTPTITGVRDDDDLFATAAVTTDGNVDKTTNIFHWIKGGISQTNMQLPFDTEVPFIPGSTGVTLDYSGYNNNGVVNGSRWVQDGVVGGALSFDGNDYVTVQENSNTLGGSGTWSAITVEAWVKASGNTTSTQTIVFKPDSNYAPGVSSYTYGYRLQYRYGSNNYRVYWIINNGTATTSINTQIIDPNPSGWHHVVATYQAGVGLKIYTDGQLRTTIVKGGNLNATLNGRLYIGGTGGTADFSGQLDEVRIYPTALSGAQVFQRFIETRDGLSSSSTIVPQETASGQQWVCQVTPNDSWADGTTRNSASLTVTTGNTRPRIDWFSPAGTTPNILQGSSLDFKQVASDPNSSPLTYAWTVNGGTVVTTQNYTHTFLTPGSITVRVTVSDGSLTDSQEWVVGVGSMETRDLEILASSDGTTNPAPGTYSYVLNTDVSVLAIPDSGYILDHWVLDGTDIGDTNPAHVIMDNLHTIQPVFVEITDLALTVNVVGSGSVTKNPDKATYIYGEDVTLSADPDTGFVFAGWSGDASGAGLTTVVDMTSNKIVTATFVPEYDLVISVSGSGTTNPSGTHTYVGGTQLQVTATPVDGYAFIGWTGSIVSGDNPVTITMDGDKTITANFEPLTSIFSTGYELGDPSWDGTTGTYAASSLQHYQGSYSGRYVTTGSTGTQNSYTTKNVNEGDVYARGYFYVDSGLPLANSGDRFYFLRFRNSAGTTLASVGVRNNGGVNQWIVLYNSGSTLNGPIYLTSLGAPSLDTWYCVELHRRVAASGINEEVWIDGVLVYQSPSINTSTAGNVAYVDVGIVSATSVQGGLVVFADSVNVNDAYIGLENAQLFDLTISVSGTGGTTSPAPGTYSYISGSTRSIDAIPDSGYMFDHWELDGVVHTEDPIMVTMDEAYTLTATFVLSPSIFSSGFEAGDEVFDTTTVTSGDSATTSTLQPHHGSNSGLYVTTGSTTTTVENAYNTVNVDEDDIYARGYFYVDTGLPLANDGDRFYFLRFRGADGATTLASVGIRRNAGVNQWILIYRSGSTLYGPVYATIASPVVDGWYEVELHRLRATSGGVVEMWINGVSAAQFTNLNTNTAGNVAFVDVGIVSSTSVNSGLRVYGDCVEIDDVYINQE